MWGKEGDKRREQRKATCLEDSDRSVREDLSISLAQIGIGSNAKPAFYKGYHPRVASEEVEDDDVANLSDRVKNVDLDKSPHFELDSTKHLKRGKGVLASRRDIEMSPEGMYI